MEGIEGGGLTVESSESALSEPGGETMVGAVGEASTSAPPGEELTAVSLEPLELTPLGTLEWPLLCCSSVGSLGNVPLLTISVIRSK